MTEEEIVKKVLEMDVTDISESARRPFVGTVVWAKLPCNCKLCEKGKQRRQFEGYPAQLHIVVFPLEEYENVQSFWYGIRDSKVTLLSGFGAFIHSLHTTLAKKGIVITKIGELVKFMVGKVFKFEYMTVGEYYKKVTNEEPPKRISEQAIKKYQYFVTDYYDEKMYEISFSGKWGSYTDMLKTAKAKVEEWYKQKVEEQEAEEKQDEIEKAFEEQFDLSIKLE